MSERVKCRERQALWKRNPSRDALAREVPGHKDFLRSSAGLRHAALTMPVRFQQTKTSPADHPLLSSLFYLAASLP